MDFTEGRLAPRNDPRNPWTTRNLLPYFIELDNRVFDRFSAEERENRRSRLSWRRRDSVHSADVPYEELLKHLFKLNAGYFQLQMASERDRESAYKLVGKPSGMTPKGWRKWRTSAASSPRPRELNRSGSLRSVGGCCQVYRQTAHRLHRRLRLLPL